MKLNMLFSFRFINVIQPVQYFSKGSKSKMSTIGFIGIGNMGGNMAKNIILRSENRNKVIVFDKNKASLDMLTAAGAYSAKSLKSLAEECDVVITMLPATAHVTEVFRGDLLPHMRPGSLIIDSSTIDPLTTRELHKEASSRGIQMLDAPVSGGVTGAAAGTLTFMVGGDDATLSRAKEILNMMGKNIVHCGGPGSGGVAKLCNNLSLAISMVGTSEAMALGVRLGMDPVRLANVMNTSTARCWSSDSYNPVPGVLPNAMLPSNNDYKGGFSSALMVKDLSLAMEAAAAAENRGSRYPLGQEALKLYRDMCEPGSKYSGLDFSSVFQYLMGETSAKDIKDIPPKK
mmetsp:Transcript_9209/g.13733  ORF Transcript_9209/g.13733 Transcript_9209/m.13733 type:complete len:345 (-) Transcript_9209:42-1076(-)